MCGFNGLSVVSTSPRKTPTLEIDIRPCQQRDRSDVDGLNSYIGPRKVGPIITLVTN